MWHQSSQAVTTNDFCPTRPAVVEGGTQVNTHMQTQIHIALPASLRERVYLLQSHEEVNGKRNNAQPSTVLFQPKLIKIWLPILSKFCLMLGLHVPASVFSNIQFSLILTRKRWYKSWKSFARVLFPASETEFTSPFSTILIIIKVAEKDRQGLCTSWAGLTWTSGKQSYSWKTFVYKSLKGQKWKKKNPLSFKPAHKSQ